MTTSTGVKSQFTTLSGITTALIALAGSALLAMAAQFAIQLPFTPVPVTMQTFAVLILAGTLGSRLAMLSCLAYLVEGTLGLPVFAHGISCPLWFLTPRVGYLIGFAVAAYVAGKLTEKEQSPSLLKQVLFFVGAELIILALGSLGMTLFVPASQALALGAAPFLMGAAYKVASAALIVRGVQAVKQ